MRIITVAIALSCLLFVDAKPGNPVTDLATTAAATATSAVSISESSVSSATSTKIAVKVPSEDDDDDEGNSPALSEDKEDDDSDDKDDEAEETEEGLSSVDGTLDENMFASAGIVYNKEKDLPVLAKGAVTSDDDYPPIPQVVACRSNGQVAITYSEGPSDTTAQIARHLNNASSVGSFFVNTSWLKQTQYTMVLQNIYNAGHLIGMTYRLPNDDPDSMSDEEIRADIIKNAKMIETLIQVSPKYVRLHFSAQNDGRAEHILKELGFILVGYNLDGKDYVHKKGELVASEYSRTFKQYRQTHDSKGSFVAIQYDIPETASLDAVPHILKTLSTEGYTAVRMDGCLNDPKPYKTSATSLEYVGDKFSFGSSGYRSGQIVSTSLISNTTVEEGIHGLSAKDDFETSAAASAHAKQIGVAALIPALFAAFML